MAVICFTGHRPNKLWGYNDDRPEYDQLFKVILKKIEEVIQDYPMDKEFTLITGMALGVDQLACAASFIIRSRMEKLGKTVTIEAAIPCRGQESKWPRKVQEKYYAMLQEVDKETYVHDGPYTFSCMNERNEYMVDHSDVVISIWDGSSGGTGSCVHYARSQHKRIVNFDPRDIAPTFNNKG